MNRLPMNIECIWLQSRPEIRFRLKNSNRGEIVFRSDEPDNPGGLLLKLVNGYANLLLEFEKIRLENKALRGTMDGESWDKLRRKLRGLIPQISFFKIAVQKENSNVSHNVRAPNGATHPGN